MGSHHLALRFESNPTKTPALAALSQAAALLRHTTTTLKGERSELSSVEAHALRMIS